MGLVMTAIWAHRGVTTLEVENTLAAFAAAVRLGIDGVELDVRATADGAPAILHDARLGDGRAIADVTVEELPDHVPLLDAALDALGDLVVNIEIKAPRTIADAVVSEVGNRGIADRVVVSSFDLATVDRVRKLDDTIPTGYLVAPAHRRFATRSLGTCRSHGHPAFHPHHRAVDARLIDAAHDAGIALNTWTVDNPDRIAQLAAAGIDAIVTNVPDVALRVLGRGGMEPRLTK
jgi:glycerophosphoryl diester phosphodiesterase